MYREEEFLALSGVQHFAFCRRQWALIHIEQDWAENALTAQGELMHARAHDGAVREKRGDVLTVRGLTVRSSTLGIWGVCDVVEFHRDASGHPLHGEDGLWLPVPVEYKRGRSKAGDEDRMQLCAQALCLEEMFACSVSTGYLFYGATRSREAVALEKGLRDETVEAIEEMHRLYARKHVPRMRRKSSICRSCSLVERCLPKVSGRPVGAYLDKMLGEAP